MTFRHHLTTEDVWKLLTKPSNESMTDFNVVYFGKVTTLNYLKVTKMHTLDGCYAKEIWKKTRSTGKNINKPLTPTYKMGI